MEQSNYIINRRLKISICNALLFAMLIFMFGACTNVKDKTNKDLELLEPISILGASTQIVLADYFGEKITIDSLRMPPEIIHTFKNNKEILELKKISPEVSILSDLKIYSKGNITSILLYAPSVLKDTSFHFDLPILKLIKEEGNQVHISIENAPLQIVPLWQNKRLGYHKSKDQKEMTILLPKSDMQNGKNILRIWASNPAGLSSELRIE